MSITRFISTAALSLSVLALSSCSTKATTVPEMALLKNGANERAVLDPCSGAERCVIGYFAPHCSRCHRSLDFIKGLRDKLSTLPGVRVVYIVGDDNHYNIEEFANEIGGDVYLDKYFKFQDAVPFDAIPHLWVIDEYRAVLEDIAWGGSGESGQTEIDNFIRGTLGLESYLK